MPGVASLARRLVALATAAACLVLIAPPAAADCCAGGCDETCHLHARPAEQEPHRHGHGDHQGDAGAQGHHHHGHGVHRADAGGRVRAAMSVAQDSHCAAACPPSAAARGTATAPAAAWAPVPDAAGRLVTGFENPPETARPARTADPRGPPPSTSIAV